MCVLNHRLDIIKDQILTRIESQILINLKAQILTNIKSQILIRIKPQILTPIKSQILANLKSQIFLQPRPSCPWIAVSDQDKENPGCSREKKKQLQKTREAKGSSGSCSKGRTETGSRLGFLGVFPALNQRLTPKSIRLVAENSKKWC